MVNLDWDHVKAAHLYKIFSSLVSPTASALASGSGAGAKKGGKAKGGVTNVARGKVLSVRVYPSEFGKERLAREEREGPPVEVFKDGKTEEAGNAEDYNEEALRKYQLERLRCVPPFSQLNHIAYFLQVLLRHRRMRHHRSRLAHLRRARSHRARTLRQRLRPQLRPGLHDLLRFP